mgnify:CR=1 FL=1
MSKDREADRPRLTRRDLLTGRFLRRDPEPEQDSPRGAVIWYPRADAPTGTQPRFTTVRPRTIPLLRPPRAVEEDLFLARCTQCGDCAAACPHDAIRSAPDRFPRVGGTPVIDPMHQPCWMCPDTPCVSACEPRALDPGVEFRMGTARIQDQTCLAHQGTGCSVCAERCPVEAIRLSEGKPGVIEASCTGCGVCQYVCPAPENAVILMPMFVRPYPDSPGDDS